MIYKCVEPFSVPQYDADGSETEDYIEIREGSIWELDNDGGTIIGADYHLDNCDGAQWLEIDGDSLKKYFKEATDHAE